MQGKGQEPGESTSSESAEYLATGNERESGPNGPLEIQSSHKISVFNVCE